MILLPESLKWVRCTPGSVSGTRKALMPRAPSSTGPVRANSTMASAWSAKLIEVFSPLSTQESPSRRALSTRLAASEPPRGSVRPSATMDSPLIMRGSQYSASAGWAWPAITLPVSEAISGT